MSNIVAFESAAVPAFLQNNQNALAMNATLAALATGFPTISIKGKVFAVVRDGDRHVMTRPDDPTAPASSIAVVIVNNSPVVKTYYAHSYTEGGEDMKPTCFSNDGVKPDHAVTQKQCDNCRLCPHNAWGTAKNESGAFTKGKACSDSVRLALAAGNDSDCYLLRVPPASLRALGQYTKMLTSKGIPLNGVLTKISFDINAAAPQLQFQFAGYLSKEQYDRAVEMGKSDQAMRIIGKGDEVFAAAPKTNQSDDPFGTTAIPAHLKQAAPAPQPVAAPAPAPKPAPQPAPAPAPVEEVSLDALFDGADVPY